MVERGGGEDETAKSSSGDYRRERSDDAAEMSVDWRGRPCKTNKQYGGMRAAVFVLGFQALEMMAIAGVGNNLISYVFNDMHFSLSKSANIVTNFVGTVFLLSLLGGFLSDSYLGTFSTILVFAFVELVGFILLAVQAHVPQLRPAKCEMKAVMISGCEEAKGYEALVFFAALYLVALGSGCLKPNIIAHGAAQFCSSSCSTDGGKQQLSTYFNAAYFAFCAGELVALTLFVWLQTHSGMDVGFGFSAAAMALAFFCFISASSLYRNTSPQGSIFTPIAQVFVAAFSKRKQICPGSANTQNNADVQKHLHHQPTNYDLLHTDKFRFLDKACMITEDGDESRWRVCSAEQVEQVKRIVSVIPIFASTIIFNTILAQLQTFSVQQGAAMDTRLHPASSTFRIPPASLQAIPYLLLIFLVPLYEAAFIPAARALTGLPSGISPLQRIGTGLFVATFSMVSAALVEAKRRSAPAALSILWIAPQFLIFGVSEMFTAVGLIEFFYMQSLQGMQSFLTALTYCSYSFGFYFSSVLVSVVNKLTDTSTTRGWLGDNNLDNDRLDLFYWLLAALSLLNFFNYLFWSNWYSSLLVSRSPQPPTTAATITRHGQHSESHKINKNTHHHHPNIVS